MSSIWLTHLRCHQKIGVCNIKMTFGSTLDLPYESQILRVHQKLKIVQLERCKKIKKLRFIHENIWYATSETRTNDHTTTTTIFPRILLKKKCVLWSNEGWNWVIYEDTSLNLHQEKPTSEYAFSLKSIKKCFMMYFHKWLRMTTSKWRAQNGSKLLTGHTELSHFKFLQEEDA